MCFEQANVHLAYSIPEFDRMSEYLKNHDVRLGGRYEQGPVWKDVGDDIEIDSDALAVKAYTHPWSNPFVQSFGLSFNSFAYRPN